MAEAMLLCDPRLVLAARAIACVPRGQERNRAWKLHTQFTVRLELRPQERSAEVTPTAGSQNLCQGSQASCCLRSRVGDFNTIASGTQGDMVKVAVLNLVLRDCQGNGTLSPKCLGVSLVITQESLT